MTDEPEEHSNTQQDPRIWFGPLSFRSAAICLTLNTIPFFINGYLIFVIPLVCVIESIAMALLCISSGRARQSGAGIAVALLGTAVYYAIFLDPARLF